MIYVIKKGRHFAKWSINRLFPFSKVRTRGHIKFSKDGWHSRDAVEHTGWNKIVGIAQAFGIHKNSGRLVWQPDFENEGVLKIAGYRYSNGGKWHAVHFVDVKVDRWYEYEVKWSDGAWVFTMNYRFTTMSGNKPKLPTKCYPYFGGRSTAPQTMKITLA